MTDVLVEEQDPAIVAHTTMYDGPKRNTQRNTIQNTNVKCGTLGYNNFNS